MIQLSGVSYMMDESEILSDIHISFEKEKMYGIIGPNGAGKSTLLSIISGITIPTSGKACLNDRELHSYSRKELAKQLAVLQQGGLPAIGFTVKEIVEMGRYPYQNWLGHELQPSSQIIDRAISVMGLDKLKNRTMEQLSGGERQRAALAQLMVQNPQVLLLDEPTTYLDIGYQLNLMDNVKQWQKEEGLTVIAVLHDLNMASLYCDELIVLENGRVCATGSPHEVLQQQTMEKVYHVKSTIIEHPNHEVPQILLQRNGEYI